MKKGLVIFILVASLVTGIISYFQLETKKKFAIEAELETINMENNKKDGFRAQVPIRTVASQVDIELREASNADKGADTRAVQSASKKESSEDTVQYEVEDDGLVTVDGDIVLGAAHDGSVARGQTDSPELNLWPDGKVPFFIQGDLEQPERVIKALAMFVDSPIQFHPYQGEEDVLVFQTAPSGCKSYLGKIGGKQPVWISPQCGVSEVAHEIMHALGFIHEQNRSDRDAYVNIQWNNIIESKKINFELFPFALMKVSGKAQFDFHSIMLYPPTTFTKNGQETIVPIDSKNEISRANNLSAGDLLRLSSAYRN